MYWFLRERRLLQDARAIHTLSRHQQQWLRDLGIGTPCLEVANGFATEDVLPEATLWWRLDLPERLLFLGRFDSYNKGLARLEEGAQRLCRFMPRRRSAAPDAPAADTAAA